MTTPPSAPRRALPASTTTPPTNESTRETTEPARRGRLVLPEKVVEKIAGQAAAEIGASWGRTGGLLGFGADNDPRARPKVNAHLSASSADLEISVGITYPQSIRQSSQQIRDHVTRRVHTLTGVSVRRVDIDVTFLAVPGEENARAGKRGGLR